MVKRISERLLSIGLWIIGLIIFIPLGLFAIIGSLFGQPAWFIQTIKFGCRFMIRCIGVRVQVEGREHFDPRQTYLFVANHVNILDVLVLFGYIPNNFKGVELEDHFQWPFYGMIIRRLGMIPISHKKPRQAVKSLEIARTTLAEGISIVILPEGGRTLTGQFKPFKRGSFVLAQKSGVDLVPLVMIGAFKILRKGSLLLRPGKMIVRFGAIIPFQTIANLEIEEVKNLVHKKMEQLFTE